jgi:hypothetical protein
MRPHFLSPRYAMENSARQEREYQARQAADAAQSFSNTAEFRDIAPQSGSRRPSRSEVPQTDTMDARDARIRQLEMEVSQLRSTGASGGRPPQQPMEMSNGFRAPSPGGVTQYREPSPQ